MDPLLSQPEIDALRETMREGPARASVRGLELCTDDRLMRRALPEFEEAAASSGDPLRLCFTRAVRGAASVTMHPGEIIPAEDARGIEERTAGRVVLHCEPGSCEAPLLIEPRLLFLHVQREFGGSLELTEVGRTDLTGLERSLLGRLAPHLAEGLCRGFQALGLKLRARGVVARPTVATTWPRQASVISLSWRVTVGAVAGNVHLLLPPAVVEALRDRVSGERAGVKDPRWRGEMIEQLRLVDVEVVAELGRAATSLSEVLRWQVGDVLRLDRSLTEQVPVMVDGRVKLRGRPGTRGDTVTLTIEEIGE